MCRLDTRSFRWHDRVNYRHIRAVNSIHPINGCSGSTVLDWFSVSSPMAAYKRILFVATSFRNFLEHIFTFQSDHIPIRAPSHPTLVLFFRSYIHFRIFCSPQGDQDIYHHQFHFWGYRCVFHYVAHTTDYHQRTLVCFSFWRHSHLRYDIARYFRVIYLDFAGKV